MAAVRREEPLLEEDLFQRAIGQDAWTTAASYHRPDLPAELQVGPVVYAVTASPDLRVSFDEVVFEDVSEPADCTSG